MRLVLLLILFALPHAARAEIATCQTSILGLETVVTYDRDDPLLRENRSYRERMFGPWGRIDCPGYATLISLTPGLTDAERSLFCLSYDKARGTYTGFAIGERDAYVGCRRPSRSFCQRVNATTGDVVAISRAGARIAVDATVTVAQSPAGASAVTGTASAVMGTLGTIGSSLVAALSAPAALAAAAVTVVTVGGVVYVCSD